MLLLKDRKQRLGQKGDAEEVLGHKFFQGLDLKKLVNREILAEFKPDQDFVRNFDSEIINQDPMESVVSPEIITQIKKEEDQFKSLGSMLVIERQ